MEPVNKIGMLAVISILNGLKIIFIFPGGFLQFVLKCDIYSM